MRARLARVVPAALRAVVARRSQSVSLVVAALTAGLLIAVASAGAGPDREKAGGHLLLVPDTKDARRALDRSDAKVVAEYGAFDLVEASGRDADRLKDAGAEQRDDMRTIELAGDSFDPVDEDSQDFGAEGGSERSLALVQFVGPIKESWLERTERHGVRLVAYVPQNAYLVAGRSRQLERLADRSGRDPVIRAVTPFTAEQKVVPGAERGKTVAVQTLSGADGAESRKQVRRQGRAVRDETTLGPYRTQYIALGEGADLDDIAAQPGVVAVAPYSVPRMRDERASQIAAGNLSAGQPLLGSGYLAWLNGKGFASSGTFNFAIDFTDEGLDTGKIPGKHPDLFRDGSTSAPTRIAYLNNYTSDDGRKPNRDCGGHATINASIAGGYNDRTGSTYEDGGLFNYGLGVAPRVLLGASKIFRCKTGAFELRGSFSSLASSAYSKGARITNNSWGAPSSGAYTTDAQTFDKLVRDAQSGVSGNQGMVEVFAAGNHGPTAGSIGSPAVAKNVIAVGASEGVRLSGTDDCGTPNAEADDARDITSFSSRGPTDDGRTKPDLVAPGTHITGAQPQHRKYNGSGVCETRFPSGSTLYSLSSGTSHSTPVVAGAAALIRDFYTRTKGTPPSPAMTKAILLNTATNLKGESDNGVGTSTTAPNGSQGWGLVNLGSVFSAPFGYVDQTTVFGDPTNSPFSKDFVVQDTGKPVKVTLVWTDAYAFVPSVPLVNNLDLVVSNDGTAYKGNDFDGNGVSNPGGTVADAKNNVEGVNLQAGTDGTVTVTVTPLVVAGDGVSGNSDSTDQDFALVVSNATPAP